MSLGSKRSTGLLNTRILLCLLALGAGISDLQPANGQFSYQQKVRPPFMQAPRPVTRVLKEGEDALQQERYADCINALYAILTDASKDLPEIYSGQDFYTPEALLDTERKVFTDTIRERADRILAGLPSEGREILAVQQGVAAQQAFESAIASHDNEAIASVARNFPHTDAAYDAITTLARQALIEGRPLAAARYFRRLLEYPAARSRFGPNLLKAAVATMCKANRRDNALGLLLTYAPTYTGESIEIDGRQIALDRSESWRDLLENSLELSSPQSIDAVAEDWTTVGGNSERNAVARTGMPIPSIRWAKKIHSNVLEKTAIEAFDQVQLRAGRLLLPKFALRMTNNYVITKTTDDTILAIDFETGNIKWLMYNTVAPLASSTAPRAAIMSPEIPSDEIQRRVWGSAAFGHFSTDRQRIYAVRERENDRRGAENYLAAYSIENEGELLWTAGGAPTYGLPSDATVPDQLRDALFLGPPLPVDGKLYCMVEARGQVTLTVLDADDGSILWQQQLVSTPQGQMRFNIRRATRLLTPSITDGLIVCPTGVGAIVAVDQLTRSIEWSYMYSLRDSQIQRSLPFRSLEPRGKTSSTWLDSRIVAGEGYIAVSPSESDQLLCIDILDGSSKRDPITGPAMMYPVAIRGGEVLVVGQRRFRWFKTTSDTSRIGPVYPKEKILAGRGVWLGDELLLPLNEQTIARVHCSTGEVLETVEVGSPVGNLFAYKNNLLSVSETEVVAYFTREALADAIEPNAAPSPTTLNRRSLLALADNKSLDAVMLLEQALKLEPENDETRYLMAEALMQGLKSDYAQFRELAIKYEDVVPDRRLKSQMMQLLALGDIEAGEYSSAFRRLLELLRNQPAEEFSPTRTASDAVELSNKHSVDTDVWITATLAHSFEQASPSERIELGKLITERASEIRSRVVAYRRRQLAYFAWLPPAHPFILELAEDLQQLRDHTAAEVTLQPVLLSGTRENVKAAERLLGKLPPMEVHNLGLLGRKGRALLQTREVTIEQLEALGTAEQVSWNRGALIVDPKSSGMQLYPSGVLVPQATQRWGRPTVRIGLERQYVSIYNALGSNVAKIRYQRTIPDDGGQQLLHATVQGGLLILETLGEVAAFDIQRGMYPRPDALLWRKTFSNPNNSASTLFQKPAPDSIGMTLGFWVSHRQISGSYATVGPLTASGVPLQMGDRLTMNHPLTGQTLWTRAGYRNRLEFLHNGRELAVVQRSANNCVVEILDSRDGSRIRQYIREETSSTWFSQGPLSVGTTQRLDAPGNGIERPHRLEIWNPFTNETVLKLDLDVGARCEQHAERHIAIVEPTGKLHYIDLQKLNSHLRSTTTESAVAEPKNRDTAGFTGHAAFPVPVSKGLDTIAVEQFGPRIVVLSNSRGEGKQLRPGELFRPDEPVGENIPVNGYVYCVDALSGKLEWEPSGQVFNMMMPRLQPRASDFMALYRTKGQQAELAMVRLNNGRLSSYLTFDSKRPFLNFAMQIDPAGQSIFVSLDTEQKHFVVGDSIVPPAPVVYLRSRL
ncbi:MAG: PQQ-binding-like beta-propeller repeat protein [Aureliella sp.]